MSPITAVKDGFSKALQFNGRSRRPAYWWFFVFVFVGAMVLEGVELALGNATGGWLTRLFQLAILLPFLAVGWRRLQDTGRPGWHLLVPAGLVVVSTLIAGSAMQRVASVAVPGADGGPVLDAGLPVALVGVLAVVQIAAGALILWWMSRPSQRGPNAYGPEPRVH